MDKKSVREIVNVVLRALTLAMGVAVVVLSCLGAMEIETAVTLLGIGLACAGVALLNQKLWKAAPARGLPAPGTETALPAGRIITAVNENP